jgi:hypothetical protein
VLRGVADDRDDHDRDEELRQVSSACECLQRADERVCDEGGGDGREAEHHEREAERPAGPSRRLGCFLQCALSTERVAVDGHAYDQKHHGNRERKLGKRAAVGVAVKTGHGSDENEQRRKSHQSE